MKNDAGYLARDPVCGMPVDPAAAAGLCVILFAWPVTTMWVAFRFGRRTPALPGTPSCLKES